MAATDARPVKTPGPDHPITVQRHDGRVRVALHGATVAESQRALVMHEASYPAVYYIPLADVIRDRLVPSDHTTWCPFKGEARYFHLQSADGALAENAVWTYPTPHAAVDAIADHAAFYEAKVDAIEISGDA